VILCSAPPGLKEVSDLGWAADPKESDCGPVRDLGACESRPFRADGKEVAEAEPLDSPVPAVALRFQRLDPEKASWRSEAQIPV
jgi:hypothetical protein